MINNSVLKAYSTVDALTKEVEKVEINGLPKDSKQKIKKKVLLSRSKETFKYNKIKSSKDDTGNEQQRLVTAYVLTIRRAFEEVKNGRTNTES